MKEWLARHLVLNREERLLVGAILLLFLCGLGVTWCRRSASADVGNRTGETLPATPPSINSH